MADQDLLKQPETLESWKKKNFPPKNLAHHKGFFQQINFVLDHIPNIFCENYEDFVKIREKDLLVISTHGSKSVTLPVYQFTLKNGTVIIMRNNFYDWKLSVISPVAIEADFMGIFNPETAQIALNCEGFPEQYVFGSFNANQKQFTIELANDYALYTFLWTFVYKVLGLNKLLKK